MNAKITAEIQAEQNHGRQKYGRGPDDFAHDDRHSDSDWYVMIKEHNQRAVDAPTMERRQHLLKVAGLAVSAIEAIDRSIDDKNRNKP
jgi:hypothetical protein